MSVLSVGNDRFSSVTHKRVNVMQRNPTGPPSNTHVALLAVHDAVLNVVLELFLFSVVFNNMENVRLNSWLCGCMLTIFFFFLDSSFSRERVGAFRSVKGLGPTMEIKKKKTFGILKKAVFYFVLLNSSMFDCDSDSVCWCKTCLRK